MNTKIITMVAVSILSIGCSERVEGVARVAYECRTSDVTCLETDARVCFTWCDIEHVDTDDNPEPIACGGRDGCTAECVEVE